MTATETQLRSVIRGLEATVADLQSRLADTRPPAALPDVDSPFKLPASEQLRALYKITTARFPMLLPKGRTGEDLERELRDSYSRFVTAFAFLGDNNFTSRIDQVNERDFSYWASELGEWHRATRNGGTNDVHTSDMLCAAISHGDIQYLDPRGLPHNYAIGLIIGTRPGSRKAHNHWRKVLAGEILPPVELPQHVRDAIEAPLRHILVGGEDAQEETFVIKRSAALGF